MSIDSKIYSFLNMLLSNPQMQHNSDQNPSGKIE